MFLPFNSVSEWLAVSAENPDPFTVTGAYGDSTVYPAKIRVAIFTSDGTITANKNIDLNIICVGGGGGGSNSAASSSTNRLGGGGGGVVIVTRSMTKGTNYVVTVGAGGAAGSAGGHSSISNAATNFIVQGDGGGGGFLSNTDSTTGSRGHPYSINVNNPVTGGSAGGTGSTTIDTSTTTGRPTFVASDGTSSISITTVVPAALKTYDSYLIADKYSGAGGTSRSRPTGPGGAGKNGVEGRGYNRTGTPGSGESASTIGSGGGGAGASSGITIGGGAGYAGIVIVWVAY